MINLNYGEKIDKKKESIYFEKLLSAKFQNGNTLKDEFKKLKSKEPYLSIFSDLNLESIIFANNNNLASLLKELETNIKNEAKKRYDLKSKQEGFYKSIKAEIEKVFTYDKFRDFIKVFFEEHLHIKTCTYCNIHFTNIYETENKKYKNEFTLDHYYAKKNYPYLALSLYNLIPSCYTCNTKLKRDRRLGNPCPTSSEFDFDKKVKFKLFFDSSSKDLNVTKKKNIDIRLKEEFSKEYEDYIKLWG